MKDDDMTMENQIPSTPEQEKAIDDALGLEKVVIRIPKDIFNYYEEQALLLGIGTIPFIRWAITWFANNQSAQNRVPWPDESTD